MYMLKCAIGGVIILNMDEIGSIMVLDCCDVRYRNYFVLFRYILYRYCSSSSGTAAGSSCCCSSR